MSQRYTIGPLDDPVLVLMDDQRAAPPASGVGAVDAYGCTWACDLPKGWDDVEFLTPVDSMAGVDGGLLAPQSIGVRTLVFEGTTICPDRPAARAARARFRNAFPRRGPVIIGITEDGITQWVTGEPTGAVKATPVSGRAIIWSFSITCADPYKYGTIAHSETGRLPTPGVGTGLTLGSLVLGDMVLVGETVQGGYVQVENLGDAPTSPVVTVKGPVWFPVISNRDTGEFTQWAIDLPDGSEMVVDYATGRTTVDGQLTDVPLAGYGSTLWQLPPGVSIFDFRARGAFSANARFTIAWKDAYR